MLISRYPVFGTVLGYLAWLVLLESEKMGGIVFRRDSEGISVFSPQNIWNMMLAPFKYLYFWKPEFWPHNWIIMCGCGILIDWFFLKQKMLTIIINK